MPTITTEATKPFYAYVGLGSLAVEQARDLSKTVPAEFTKLPEHVSEHFKARVEDLKTLPATVQSQLKSLPETVVSLPTTAKTQFETYQTKGQEFYGDLVTRGEKLVSTIRRQPSTKVAEKDLADTKASVKGTATLTKKTTKATGEAVKAAANA